MRPVSAAAMHGLHPIHATPLLFHHSLIHDIVGEQILQEDQLIGLYV
jgi:hypothetical protein